MNRFLSCFATNVGLFILSLGLGGLSYLLVHDGWAGITKVNTLPRETLLLADPIVLGAEPHLLGQAQSPVDAAGDAFGIHYILQADGKILRIAPEAGGELSTGLYASLGDERTEPSPGFSGLVLHPQFLLEDKPGYGRFYIVVAEKAGAAPCDFLPEFGGENEHHQDVLYEYQVEDPLLTEFRGTRREVMRFRQPGAGHNVRGLAFDPQGFLYLGVGDGAHATPSASEAARNGSSLANVYGKVLRIDPLGSNAVNGQYGIPKGNPFRLVTEALPELWAFGLRAPESLTYDPFQRGLCIAERAHPDREEINLSLRGGEHFGWDIAEHADRLSRADRIRLDQVVTSPALSISRHAELVSRTVGGVIYRGENFPSLAGALLFASHDGQLLALRDGAENTSGAEGRLSRIDLGRFSERRLSALRQGPRGELLFLCEDGSVFEMRKAASLGTGGSKQRSLFCGTTASRPDRS